jgi:hypothetical protein
MSHSFILLVLALYAVLATASALLVAADARRMSRDVMLSAAIGIVCLVAFPIGGVIWLIFRAAFGRAQAGR